MLMRFLGFNSSPRLLPHIRHAKTITTASPSNHLSKASTIISSSKARKVFNSNFTEEEDESGGHLDEVSSLCYKGRAYKPKKPFQPSFTNEEKLLLTFKKLSAASQIVKEDATKIVSTVNEGANPYAPSAEYGVIINALCPTIAKSGSFAIPQIGYRFSHNIPPIELEQILSYAINNADSSKAISAINKIGFKNISSPPDFLASVLFQALSTRSELRPTKENLPKIQSLELVIKALIAVCKIAYNLTIISVESSDLEILKSQPEKVLFQLAEIINNCLGQPVMPFQIVSMCTNRILLEVSESRNFCRLYSRTVEEAKNALIKANKEVLENGIIPSFYSTRPLSLYNIKEEANPSDNQPILEETEVQAPTDLSYSFSE
jgi:hypothetical protein